VRFSRWLNIWGPAILAISMILLESTPLLSGENTGHWLLSFSVWLGKLTGTTLQLPWWDINLVLRKTGHVVGYGVVSLLFVRSWRLSRDERAGHVWRRLELRGVVFALLSTLVLAAADEFHQSFLPERTSSIHDVMLDMLGASVAQILLYLYARQARVQYR
jgi:VanZ family protein